MSRRIPFPVLLLLVSLDTFGRPMQSYDMKTLIGKSELVFVGRVRSVQPSGLTTSLTYPSWDGVSFKWLAVEVEVLEPIKGVQRADIVHTVLLSSERRIVINPPGTVEPKQDEAFLLCLLPTTLTNVFAAVTSPFDEDQSVFRLDRSDRRYSSYRKGSVRRRLDEEILGAPFKEHDAWVWRLVTDDGAIVPGGARRMRKAFAKQIQMQPTPTVIYLQWEIRTNSAGWRWNAPKANGTTSNPLAQ